MDRISTASKAVDLYGAGKHGLKDGDIALGVQPTSLNAEWFNGVQEELLGLIEATGQVGAAGTLNQVTKAVKRLAASGLKSVTSGATVLLTDDAGLIRIDASAGNVTLTLPAANVVASLGIEFMFYRTDATANVVIVNRAGADTIDGANSFTISGQYSQRTIRGNGSTAWSTTSVTATASSAAIRSIAATVAANAMTVTVNPCSLDFRSPTLTVGVPNTRTISAAQSLVIPAGATLGTSSGVVNRVAVLAIDNAGTVEVAVVNMACGLDLMETGLISTTAISAAADSINVVYSTTARTNVPYRIVGYVESTQVTAGNWATAPSMVQGSGGLATSEIVELLGSYAPVNMIGSRSLGVVYTNTSRRKKVVSVSVTLSPATTMTTEVSGNVYETNTASHAEERVTRFDVPPGAEYRVSNAGTLTRWMEH